MRKEEMYTANNKQQTDHQSPITRTTKTSLFVHKKETVVVVDVQSYDGWYENENNQMVL
jgi:hypothetical protein